MMLRSRVPVNKMTTVVVYTKEGCHLCENVISTLEKLASERHLEISTRDISETSEMYERYKYMIPVVEVNGKIKLGGSTLSNQNTLEIVLRRAIFP
jgi:glutaredoxin